MPSRVALGLGSNLLDKQANLTRALRALSPFARVTAISSLYRTEPVGFLDQDCFLNAVALAETLLEPHALLESLQDVELSMGRVRAMRNGPRVIDLDILLWEDRVVRLGSLEIPHPRMANRHFVMVPLNEIAPRWVHPVLAGTVSELYERLGPPEGVELLSQVGWPPEDIIR